MRDQSIAPPILALVLTTAMSPLALNIFLPSMPNMAREFGVASTDIQPAVSLYFLGVAFGQLIYGPLSDRYGRRPILLI
ncbi:MAG: MFS transporter, partial [Sphingomonadales bacterium]